MTMGMTVFVLQLGAADFNDKAVCLGPQIATVLETLIDFPELSEAAWYAVWVDAMGASPDVIAAMKHYEGSDERSIPDIRSFIAMSRTVTQFLSGVFFGVPANQPPELSDGIDQASDVLALNGLVEVRAEDTTFIEVVTARSAIYQRFLGKTLAG